MGEYKPLDESLPAPVADLARALRTFTEDLGVSLNTFASMINRDPGAVSRLLSGRRRVPRGFVDELLAAFEELHKTAPDAKTVDRLRKLHRAALEAQGYSFELAQQLREDLAEAGREAESAVRRRDELEKEMVHLRASQMTPELAELPWRSPRWQGIVDPREYTDTVETASPAGIASYLSEMKTSHAAAVVDSMIPTHAAAVLGAMQATLRAQLVKLLMADVERAHAGLDTCSYSARISFTLSRSDSWHCIRILNAMPPQELAETLHAMTPAHFAKIAFYWLAPEQARAVKEIAPGYSFTASHNSDRRENSS